MIDLNIACTACAMALQDRAAGVDGVPPWDRPQGWEEIARDALTQVPATAAIGESQDHGTARVIHCGVCGFEIEDRYYPLEITEVAVNLPSDVVRIPRTWVRNDAGKAIAPLHNDHGGLDIVIHRDDLTALLPDVTGWVSAGKFDTMLERFEECQSVKIVDRVAILLESLECAVTVDAWARGERPTRGATDTAAIADRLPGSRRAARHENSVITRELKAHRHDGESRVIHVRGVNGLADMDVSAPAGAWEYHIPETAGWLNSGGHKWFDVLSRTQGAKFKRCVKKLLATGEFTSTLV